MLSTTFNMLKAAGACESGYRTLAKSLGGITAYGADRGEKVMLWNLLTRVCLMQAEGTNHVEAVLWVTRRFPPGLRGYYSRAVTELYFTQAISQICQRRLTV